MQSPNNTLVGPGQSITDAAGNVWTITPGGQITLNGVVDNDTANVTHLAYANGVIWQENTQDLWWSKASPSAPWSPPNGTAVVPVPIQATQNDSVIGASTGGPAVSITDRSGNTWAIVGGKIAVNGIVDPTTANVIELAYVNGTIWQENTQHLWWSKSTPAGAWGPPNGTAVNPVTGGFYIDNTSGNAAIINVGELTASPEGSSGIAPGSTAQIVTPGVQANGTTITVSTETATLVVQGSSSLTNHATLNLIGAYRTPSEVSGPLQNNGAMTVNASELEVGALSGTGSVKASNGSTLIIQSADGGNSVQLQSSHLFIGGQGGFSAGQGVPGGMSFLAPITMDSTSSIVLNATQATNGVLKQSGGSITELLLFNGSNEVADLKISGVSTLYAMESGSGAGATVTLSTTYNAHDILLTH